MPRARRQPQPGRRTDARRNHVPLVRTRPHAAVRNLPAHCCRKREGATQFPTIGLFERNANNFKGTRNTKAQKSWSSRAEPEVRIHLPPAESRVRTRLTAHASQHQRRTPRLLVNGSQLWRLRQVEQVVEEDRVVARHDIRRPCRGCQRDRGAGHLHGSQHSANSGENRRSSQPRNRRRNPKACARPAACALVTTFYTYPEPTPT